MVLADNFAHQSFRKQTNMPDSPPSRPPLLIDLLFPRAIDTAPNIIVPYYYARVAFEGKVPIELT